MFPVCFFLFKLIFAQNPKEDPDHPSNQRQQQTPIEDDWSSEGEDDDEDDSDEEAEI